MRDDSGHGHTPDHWNEQRAEQRAINDALAEPRDEAAYREALRLMLKANLERTAEFFRDGRRERVA